MSIQSLSFQIALLILATVSGLLSPLVAVAATVISAAAIPAVVIATTLAVAKLIPAAARAYKEMRRDQALADLDLSR